MIFSSFILVLAYVSCLESTYYENFISIIK